MNMPQLIWMGNEGYFYLTTYLKQKEIKKLFLVCDQAIAHLPLDHFFTQLEQLGITITRFNNFCVNPRYESIVDGVECFLQSKSQAIIAIGGGSTIDVAKCIKLYSTMDSNTCYLEQKIIPNKIMLIAIPTTAGTGSEATRYAVIYQHGEKQSITHESCIPSVVILDPSLLKTLPDYQKKSAMMDALCHGIESGWSIHSNVESMEYSLSVIKKIMKWMQDYLEGNPEAANEMLTSANLAGKAINITQTTASHAMSYKLTSLYGISHGHAVAICLPHLWKYMRTHLKTKCIDPRGYKHVEQSLIKLAEALGCPDTISVEQYLMNILRKLKLTAPQSWKKEDILILANSVNPVRLKNNPIMLDSQVLMELYGEILLNT